MNVWKQLITSLNPKAYVNLIENSQKTILRYILFVSLFFSGLDVLIQYNTFRKIDVMTTVVYFAKHVLGQSILIAILTLVFALIGFAIVKLTRLNFMFGSVVVVAFYSLTLQYVLVELILAANVFLNIEIQSYDSIIVSWLYFIFVVFRVAKQRRIE